MLDQLDDDSDADRCRKRFHQFGLRKGYFTTIVLVPCSNGSSELKLPPLEPIDFDDFATLGIPARAGRKHRDQWPDFARALVDVQEKRAVQVVGYLIRVRLEAPESPNCHSDDPAQRDFHLWLTKSPLLDADESEAVVVEITPRIRVQHPNWSFANLRRLGMQHSPIRASGWLMFDSEHPEQVGRTRATLWEIHPVTKIEVLSYQRWREL